MIDELETGSPEKEKRATTTWKSLEL